MIVKLLAISVPFLFILALWSLSYAALKGVVPGQLYRRVGCEDRWHDGGPNQSDCVLVPC